MTKNILKVIFLLAALFIWAKKSNAQEEISILLQSSRDFYEIKEPRKFSDTTRHITNVSQSTIRNAPVNSVGELLDFTAGVDVQKRSPYGIQADFSLRGSTSEQVLILIDGIRVNDAQTAHHNSDLPLVLSDIESIEVLHGQGSSLFGADAFGGVINIITKKAKKDSLSAKIKIGDYATRTVSVTAEKKVGKFSQRISAKKDMSNGTRYDTDFDNLILTSKSSFMHRAGDISLLLGFMDKEFGAYDFYTPGKNLPSREWTSTYFANLSILQKINSATISTKIFHRRHSDKFILDQTNPDFYKNNHQTFSRGAEIKTKFPIFVNGDLTLASDFNQEELKSSNLGNHIRERYGAGVSLQIPISNNIFADTSARTDFPEEKHYTSLSFALAFWITNSWKLRTSIGNAFRIPSFTELYYTDPVNTGNPYLKPEEALNYEIGTDFLNIKNLNLSATFFYREQKNLIDWVGTTQTGPWFAQNIGKFDTYGIETLLQTYIVGFDLRLEYSYIDSTRNKNYFSKYALGYKSNQFSIGLKKTLFWNLFITTKALYRNKEGIRDYILLNTRLTKKFTRDFEVFLEGTNLLNIYYEEIPGIPLPGRWLSAGINWQII